MCLGSDVPGIDRDPPAITSSSGSGEVHHAARARNFSRRSLLGGLIALAGASSAAQGTPVGKPPPSVPRVSIPVWPAREADLYGPAANVPWVRQLSGATLLTTTSTGEIVGGLGLSPALSADRQQLTLDIRPDALFANHAPVTPTDVVDSLHWAWAVGLQGDDAWRWQHVEAVVRSGERAVSILLQEPDASIPALLSSWRVPVVPSMWLAAINHRVGIGPPPASGYFNLQSRTPDRIDFTRNAGFYQVGRPRLAGVTCIAPDSLLARGTDLVTGRVDIVIDLPLLDVPMLRENPGFNLVGGASARLTALHLNLRSDPLRDQRFRSLLARTVRRDQVLEVAVAGEGRLATSLIPADLWAGIEFPVEQAEASDVRADLATLGMLPGIELRLVAPAGDASLANACVTLQEQFAWAGFALALDLLDEVEMARELQAGTWDLLIETLPWWHDPHELVWPLLTTGGPANRGGYSSRRLDYLAALACRARGITERATLYQSIQELVAREHPLIPLYFGNYYDAMTTNVTGYLAYPPESAAAMAQATIDSNGDAPN
jgi:peptide/nickel transport system substrate-binding protein